MKGKKTRRCGCEYCNAIIDDDMRYCLRCEDLMFDAWVDNHENGNKEGNN